MCVCIYMNKESFSYDLLLVCFNFFYASSSCVAQVIVMDRTWKSKLDHGTMAFLRPNPFYMGVVRAVLSNTKVHGRKQHVPLFRRYIIDTKASSICVYELLTG